MPQKEQILQVERVVYGVWEMKLELARQSKVEGLTCPEILGELAEKLTTKLNRKINNGDGIFTGTNRGFEV